MDVYDNIKLQPCPMCGGTPLMLVMRQSMEHVVSIQCGSCGQTRTPGIMFRSDKRLTMAMGKPELLPDLATARRQAAAAWNGRADGHAQD